MVDDNDTKQRLREVFDERFGEDPDYQLDIDDSNPRRLVAILTASEFEDQSEIERQNTIWDLLEAELTDEQRAEIVIVIANTPDESDDWDEARRGARS